MDNTITNIALVDDHSLLRGTLASLINSFDGYTVLFEADNGLEFIEKLKNHPRPHVVLLDITMPEMDGYETATWIKKNIPSVKILVLSMSDQESDIIRMLREGARGYLLKDSKPAVLRKALEEVRVKGFYMNELVSNKMLNFVTGNGPHSSADIPLLTEKEAIFLEMACTEMTYKEIADKMKMSQRTVEGYRDDLFKKLNVVSRVGLVVFAIRHGLCKV
ncbi:MAG: response regulator transcription factor [Chitinophagaceae bacterium]|nr:response regulator transcription factor [Chitinophagaceae bacterium]